MRFSPVLVGFLAASALFGVSQSVRAETDMISPTSLSDAVTPPDSSITDSSITDSSIAENPTLDVAIANVPANSSLELPTLLADSVVEEPVTKTDIETIETEVVAAEPSMDEQLVAIAPTPALTDIPVDTVFVPSADEVAIAEPDTSGFDPTATDIGPVLLAQSDQDTPDRLKVEPGGPTAPSAPIPTTPPTVAPPPSAPEPVVPSESEPRVLVGEVQIKGTAGEIPSTVEDEVYKVIRTQPGRTTTKSQLQEDINAIFGTGFFTDVRAEPEDTPLGVRVTFLVTMNPVLKSVQIDGSKVLPATVVDEAFRDQYGSTLNLVQLQNGIKRLNQWYQSNGYVLAQVIDAPKVTPDGTVTLSVAEGEIEGIQVRFINKEGSDKDAKGNPIKGRTRDFIVTREFQLKPGDVFNRSMVERDLQRVFGLGIFDDVRLSLNPGTDPRKVVLVANVAEKNTGSIALSGGISSASGLFGAVSYQQLNLGGNNQRFGAEVQLGQRELLFDLNFTDPWIAGDPYRTSYTINMFRRRTISLIFDGGDPEVRLPEDNDRDRPRVSRTGGGISFSRPLSKEVFKRSEWSASAGLQFQRVVIQDSDGNRVRTDELGNDLSFSGKGRDDLFTLQFGAVRDRRNDPLRPTSGSLLRFGTEQSIPIGTGSLFFNRLRGSYSFYVPTRLLRISKGCQDQRIIGTTDMKKPTVAECPQSFAFNVQGGTVLGDLPPYEAFSMGGSNSVRGYEEGELGSAKSYVQATAEYRFPLFSIINGALFIDAATDFGTGKDVVGRPAIVRGKPGEGIGYGIGVRIQSPLGPIRVDYGFNDQGESRLHFGIGERF